ncbi:hypothetical protein BDV38DRAFT_210395 [Aspergillus pseudotamarii]|uniref:Uncharacterized protein n=1 Tax=Aspergillus pseudotamarii TaxID=132259 RepID=A0A5N6SH94_ASPPS|nr:uncharacterized protein BDV38DRAFT_210395 [Aspergillus pseudotamarii]KAE8132484.1 hypothetical protein BDV38DRAFT_210395 [Aspergillus pseudotamarii]
MEMRAYSIADVTELFLSLPSFPWWRLLRDHRLMVDDQVSACIHGAVVMLGVLCLHFTDAFSRSLHTAWWHSFILQTIPETGRRWSLVYWYLTVFK